MPDILAEFGAQMADSHGAMDRAKMRELVFREPPAKRRLEAILHPMIRDATLAAAADASGDYVMLAIPLLVESGAWKQRVNRVLVIDCPEEVQVARVMARNGLAEDQVRAIMATQVPRTVRLAAADDIIDNGGTIEALTPQVDRLHGFYQQYL
jgi:dephospho-CoA kinase